MNPLVTRELTKRFRGTVAVNSVNLDVPLGSIYALVGPNGAGKTTLIKALMNIDPPTSGSAEVLGCNSRRLSPREFRQIGYVSENQQLPDWMTVGYLMRYLRPFYPTWDDARERELIDGFSLPRDRKIRHLSRGMWMKTALAASLACRPSLLLLDEPFSGLDPLVRDEFIQAVLTSADETTILCSSHDLAEIETLATHVGFMESGVLRCSEELTTLAQRFRVVEVTLSKVPLEPPKERWPEGWIETELAPSYVRFIDTSFDLDRTNSAVRSAFEGVTNVVANPMPLRAIFLAMARSYRK